MKEGQTLKRTLTFPKLYFFTIISVLDAGIFLLPFIAYREAGTSSIFGWLLAGIIAISLSLVFSELAYNFPKSGGLYEYTKQAFGIFPSFLVGWLSFLISTITLSMLLIGAIKFLNPNLPNSIIITISFLFIMFISFLVMRGLDESIIMVLTFGGITLFTLFYITSKTFSPGNIMQFIESLKFNVKSALLATFLVFETFLGLEGTTYMAEETKEPKKTLPRALFYGMLTIVMIVMIYVISTLSFVPQEALYSNNPLQKLIENIARVSQTTFFELLIYLSIIGSASSLIVTTPRLVYSIARDKLLPPEFTEIDEKFKTPKNAIIFTAVVSAIITLFSAASFETLLSILMPLSLFVYVIVLLAYYKLKITKKLEPISLSIPLFQVTIPLLILANISFILAWVFSEAATSMFIKITLSLILFAIPLWISVNFYYNPDAIISFTTLFAWLNYSFEDYILPKRIRKEILNYFESWQNQKVIEYGAGVGTLTLNLAYEVGKEGKIYAIDASKKNLEILKKRAKKLGFDNIHVIHDEHMFSRIYPEIKYADALVSVGVLTYVQDLDIILRRLSKIIPDNGKVIFVEYMDMFKIFPNPPRIKNYEKLKEKFRKYGFYVNVHKRKGLFWNYLIIYGIKSKDPVSFI